MIAPTQTRCELIWSGKQGIDFGTSEELDQGAGEVAAAGDGEHALDLCRMGRRLESRVSKEAPSELP